MWDQIGKAVVEERTNRRQLAELRRFLHTEVGSGDGAEAYLAAARVQMAKVEKDHNGIFQALKRAIRAFLSNDGEKTESKGAVLSR